MPVWVAVIRFQGHSDAAKAKLKIVLPHQVQTLVVRSRTCFQERERKSFTDCGILFPGEVIDELWSLSPNIDTVLDTV